MGGERLSESPKQSEPDAGGQPSPPASSFRMTDVFERECGFYLHIGMSASEYWDGDPCAVRWYRDKYLFDIEKVNHDAWLQGMYIYEALLLASPAVRPFVKHPKPGEYPDKPYPITERMRKKDTEKQKRDQMQVAFTAFKAKVDAMNNNKKRGGEVKDGG